MAARKRPASLRVVGPNEAARRKTIVEAAESGTSRELLEATKLRVAAAVESPETPPRDLAALSRRLIEIDKELRALTAIEEEVAERGPVGGDEEWQAI